MSESFAELYDDISKEDILRQINCSIIMPEDFDPKNFDLTIQRFVKYLVEVMNVFFKFTTSGTITLYNFNIIDTFDEFSMIDLLTKENTLGKKGLEILKEFLLPCVTNLEKIGEKKYKITVNIQ